MTTSVKRPMLNLPTQIPVQLLLYKTTTCLTRPATTFFWLENEKKACLKQQLQNFIQRRNAKKHIEQRIKNKLSDYIYSILLHNPKFV